MTGTRKTLEFLRATRLYPKVRKAIRSEGHEAAVHRARMYRAFGEVTTGVLDFKTTLVMLTAAAKGVPILED